MHYEVKLSENFYRAVLYEKLHIKLIYKTFISIFTLIPNTPLE